MRDAPITGPVLFIKICKKLKNPVIGACAYMRGNRVYHFYTLFFHKKVVYKKVVLFWAKPSKNLRKFQYLFPKLKKVYKKYTLEIPEKIKISRMLRILRKS